MADTAQPRRPDGEMPTASEAFRTTEQAGRGADAAAARAAALLVMTPPRRPEDAVGASVEHEEFDSEERRDLGIERDAQLSVDPFALAGVLEGVPGQARQIAQILYRMREDTRASRRAWEGEARQVAAQLNDPRIEAFERTERDLIDRAQQHAATAVLDASEPVREGTALVALSLVDRNPIVRIAAAGATLRADPMNPVARAMLTDAMTRSSADVALLAAAIWAYEKGNDYRRFETLAVEAPGVPERRRSRKRPDSALIHGTWARGSRWWRPEDRFHHYLSTERVFPNLYSGGDTFSWSGSYAFRRSLPWDGKIDWSRLQAGGHLAWWAERRLAGSPYLIGHSYGGSLAMTATRLEKRVRGLLLLSPAIHETCLPDENYYDGILLIRVKRDLVLLADRSSARLPSSLPNVTERIVARRTTLGHLETHDVAVWEAEGLADYVRQWRTNVCP